MGSRLELHEKLVNILGNDHVYFQPPPSIRMEYPAIRYNLQDIYTSKADNLNYRKKKRYIITLIHKDPDNTIVDDLVNNNFQFEQFYAKDGLNHYVFTIYYKGE